MAKDLGNINQFKRGRKTPDCELQQCLRSLRILDFSIWEAAWPESRISDPSESSSSFFFPSACVAIGSPVVDLFHSAQAILAHWYISVVWHHQSQVQWQLIQLGNHYTSVKTVKTVKMQDNSPNPGDWRNWGQQRQLQYSHSVLPQLDANNFTSVTPQRGTKSLWSS